MLTATRRALSFVSILQRFGRVLTQVQIGERLAAGVADYVTTGDGVGPLGRREAAG